MPKAIGYARVSTDDQRTLRQVDELRAAGCGDVLEERASGGDRSRPVLAALLRRLGRGDTLVVTKLDRLARSLEHLLEVVRGLEAKGAYLRVLGDPIDTATPQGRLVLQMLGAVAEFERALIRERVVSGLARAAREGRRGGNPAIRARDPDALRRLQHAREDAYLAQVSASADAWLPLVAKLRLEEGRTWDDVVRAVNVRLSAKGAAAPLWTQARLVRAVRALVRDGLAPAELLQARGHKRTTAVSERNTALRTVAAIVSESPDATLRAIGDRLSALRLYPQRGGTHWSTSSVAHLLKTAKRQSLLQPPPLRGGVAD
ncbi:recombinase family protein [Roseomonas sp. M0104]|uniref:Recombinase family protein n=1 Tax=Teichococcus coralli TaxID=2545983 RepID=A0A845BHM4_9PROT|nr:recombinase family protein [Pseudoroseomonas coralli]MXP65646.1 recombinase family protein [Pseudoroseomonas coralli]